jgi:SAM-dependent methyltransferase
MASTFNARDAAVYERSMGRWSRRLAPGFAAFAGIGRAERVLDVGCGTGSLVFELADNPGHTQLVGIDASEIYLAAAREHATDTHRFSFHHGDACAMPFVEDEFDAALCQLVLQFVPQPGEAVAEMRRVVRPGGTVAAAVWNSGGGMPHQRMFWDTAAMLDPAAAELRGKTFSRPMTRQDDLYGPGARGRWGSMCWGWTRARRCDWLQRCAMPTRVGSRMGSGISRARRSCAGGWFKQ